MLARFLFACLELSTPETKQTSIRILEEHTDQSRFKGTKVYLESPSVSPDYKIVAKIDHTENGGSDIYLTWTDINGVKSGIYKLKPEDKVSIIGVKDAHSLNVKPSPPNVVRAIQLANHEKEDRPDSRSEKKPPIQRIADLLRTEGIEHSQVSAKRIVFGAKKYYIEYVGGEFEIGHYRRGVISTFRSNSSEVKRLIRKVRKIDESIDFEKELEKIG
jgi:hypothetical protein